MLKRFLSYYKPHSLLFAADMGAALLVSLIGVLYPVLTRNMLNDFIPNRRYRLVIFCGVLLMVLYIIRMLLNYFIQYQGHVMGVRIQAQMRSDLFGRLQVLPFRFFDTHETGKIMSRMTNDLMDISELAHHGPENLLISTITIVVSFVYLTTINVWLTLIIFSAVPFLLLVAMLLRRRMRDAFMRSREAIAQINASLEGSISGIRVTRAFNNSKEEKRKFEIGNRLFVRFRSQAYNEMGKFHSMTSFITDVFNVIVLIAGGLFLYHGKIQLGDYSSFIVSVGVFLTPVLTLINFTEQYQNGVTGFRRFCEIMDQEPERDLPDATELTDVRGKIEFRNVSYSYAEGREVLHNVSFSIEPGQTYALVGPSGGGKTTICHLIPRFYPISDGAILIDGQDISHLTARSLRQSIGIVQQDVYLFNATVRDNILYGKPDATQEEVEYAAKCADIHDDILAMEHGYDTVIGERGVRLSGGQKQRLSIARVFLKNPPILILDEATSALDNATELQIQRSLDRLCRGRTTIVVAHRLTTIHNADRIAVIERGVICEEGTHEELLEKNGVYAALYQRL